MVSTDLARKGSEWICSFGLFSAGGRPKPTRSWTEAAKEEEMREVKIDQNTEKLLSLIELVFSGKGAH